MRHCRFCRVIFCSKTKCNHVHTVQNTPIKLLPFSKFRLSHRIGQLMRCFSCVSAAYIFCTHDTLPKCQICYPSTPREMNVPSKEMQIGLGAFYVLRSETPNRWPNGIALYCKTMRTDILISCCWTNDTMQQPPNGVYSIGRLKELCLCVHKYSYILDLG